MNEMESTIMEKAARCFCRQGKGEHNNGTGCNWFLRQKDMESTIIENAAKGFRERRKWKTQ